MCCVTQWVFMCGFQHTSPTQPPASVSLQLGRSIGPSFYSVSGTIGTNLLLVPPMQPAELVASAAEADAKRVHSDWLGISTKEREDTKKHENGALCFAASWHKAETDKHRAAATLRKQIHLRCNNHFFPLHFLIL